MYPVIPTIMVGLSRLLTVDCELPPIPSSCPTLNAVICLACENNSRENREMMKEIVGKLKQLMTKLPVEDEPTVAYLLMEVRKTFERDEQLGQSFPTLTFYCDWVVHTELTRGRAQRFLSAVMPILTLDGSHTEAQHQEFDRLFTLRTFRHELGLYLNRVGVDPAISENPQHWSAFMAAYSRIVQNCELVVKGSSSPSGPLNLAVSSLSIKALPTAAPDANHPYPMVWSVQYADGRTGELILSGYGLAGALLTIQGPTPQSVSVLPL